MLPSDLIQNWHTRWPHFKPHEVACHGCSNTCGRNALGVQAEALDCLEALRVKMNRPLSITSAFRCIYHNARVRGAARSRHKVGDAFDVSTRGMSVPEKIILYDAAKEIGFRGFGRYVSFLHVDLGALRSWVGNNGRQAWLT